MKLTLSKGDLDTIRYMIDECENMRQKHGELFSGATALGSAASSLRRVLKEHYRTAGYEEVKVTGRHTVTLGRRNAESKRQ